MSAAVAHIECHSKILSCINIYISCININFVVGDDCGHFFLLLKIWQNVPFFIFFDHILEIWQNDKIIILFKTWWIEKLHLREGRGYAINWTFRSSKTTHRDLSSHLYYISTYVHNKGWSASGSHTSPLHCFHGQFSLSLWMQIYRQTKFWVAINAKSRFVVNSSFYLAFIYRNKRALTV